MRSLSAPKRNEKQPVVSINFNGQLIQSNCSAEQAFTMNICLLERAVDKPSSVVSTILSQKLFPNQLTISDQNVSIRSITNFGDALNELDLE